MATRKHFPFPLGELLHLLKAKGFDVSIENILQLQSVFLSSSALHMQPKELKYILGPLFAKNEEEQAELYRLVDDYVDTKTKETNTPRKRFWKLLRNNKNLFWLKLAALVLVVITAVVFYFVQSSGLQKKKPAATTNDSIKTSQQTPSTPGEKSNSSSPSTEDTSGIAKKHGDLKLDVTYTQPVKPERKNSSLQLSLFIGVSLGAILFNILFNEKRKLMETEEKNNRVQTEDIDKEHLTSANFGMEAEPKRFEVEPVNLTFPSRNYLIQHSREFLRIRAALKKPLVIEGESLNIRKSIYATTRKAGFVSLMFDEQSKSRKIVVLIEGDAEGHMTQLFDYFTHFLQAEKLPVRKFYYKNEIISLTDEAGGPHTFQEISREFNDHHLLVFGSGSDFFTEAFELKKTLISLFRSWENKYLITPRPLNDWDQLEDELIKQGFQVIPAEIEAIELLTAAMVDQSVISKKNVFHKIKQHYSIASFDLESATGIRNYLQDERLFQLVCALSVYPKLDWNLTLSLMEALEENEGQRQVLLHYNTLLKIARIPCLRNSELRPALRLELLNHLKPATEVRTRETIVKILKDIQPHLQHSSLAYTELDVQLNLNAFFLFAHDEWKYQSYSYTRNAISDYWESLEDWVLKERVAQQISGIMPLNALGKPQTINEYIIKEKEIEIQQLQLSKAYVLMLPALVLYILFFIFKPDFVYGAVKKVSIQAVIQKDPSCADGFNYLEIYGDKISSVQLQPSAKTESIEIKDVDPERTVTLKLIGKDKSKEIVIPAKYGLVTIGLECD